MCPAAWEPWVLQLCTELLAFMEPVKASGGWVVGQAGQADTAKLPPSAVCGRSQTFR